VPSGIFHSNTTCLIGTGVCVNPTALLEELSGLEAAGVDTDNLLLANRAHMLMPYHRILDSREEEARGGNQIGTTMRGIGPAYVDKAARSGVRLGDLKHPKWLRKRLELLLPRVNKTLDHFGAQPVEIEQLLSECSEWNKLLGHRIVDPLPLVRQATESGKNILLEGQLGVMRDLDWGTYPFVTSSNPTAAYAPVGAGIPPQQIDRVLGVTKAYATAVGSGPFPAELIGATGDQLRQTGKEFGATTGRPRRVGWFDAVAVRHAAWLNGLSGLAITKLDVLDAFAEISICTGYRLPDGSEIDFVPDTPVLETIEPVLESWPGWEHPTNGAASWHELPRASQRYLERLSELCGTSIQYVSVGPKREAMFSV
jgi:adenylosuccinate synthase